MLFETQHQQYLFNKFTVNYKKKHFFTAIILGNLTSMLNNVYNKNNTTKVNLTFLTLEKLRIIFQNYQQKQILNFFRDKYKKG